MKHIFMILFILFSIVGFADVAPAMNIRFNDIKMVIPKQFELVRPVNKKEVIAENNFLLKKILKDWEAVKQVSIDDEKLSQENLYTMGVIARQLKRTKYSAWEIFPLLDKQLNAYLATSNEQYLSMFLKFYNYFISVRMDNKGRKNYAGVILPQWERLDRYNIFTVSPYKKYDVAIKDKLMRERGWSSLFFSDVNYSGLILSPILRFVQIVRGNDLKKYYTDVDSMLADAEKVIASHENEWVRVNSGSGYYIFPKNSPWYLDGVEIPVNEAAIFGNALVRAYLASGKKKYLVRAQQMWWRWKNYISKDPFGYICYPYFTGAPFKGWDKHDHISVNTPVFNPESRKAYEVFHKAALTIDFLVLLEQACPGSTVEYLKEFYYLMIAAIKTNSLTSCFPRLMGFAYPLNTYHSAMPFGFRGWTHLASQSPLFRSMAPILLINEKKSLDNLLYFQIVTGKDIDEFEFVSFSQTVTPLFLNDKGQHWLWRSPISGLVTLKFQHTSPKHNTLYLYDPLNNKIRIRMDITGGAFYGAIYPTKNECVDLRWKKSKYGAPANAQENKLTLTYYKEKAEFIKEIGGSEAFIVSPRYLIDEADYCLWRPPISGTVKIKFKHTSSKHNTLYLYDVKNNNRKIKLRLRHGTFITDMYVKKNKCIDLRWKKSKYGSPNSEEENKITIQYLSHQIIQPVNHNQKNVRP